MCGISNFVLINDENIFNVDSKLLKKKLQYKPISSWFCSIYIYIYIYILLYIYIIQLFIMLCLFQN